MSKGRRRDTNDSSLSPRSSVHAPPSPRRYVDTGVLVTPARVLRPPVQPRADQRRWQPPTARSPFVQYSGIQKAPTRLSDAPRVFKGQSIRWSPGASKTARAQVRKAVRRVDRYVANRFGNYVDRQTKAILAFAEPQKLVLCKARKLRKRVLHAFGLTGSGGGRQPRPPRYTDKSGIHC